MKNLPKLATLVVILASFCADLNAASNLPGNIIKHSIKDPDTVFVSSSTLVMSMPDTVVNTQYSLEKNWRAYTKGSAIAEEVDAFVFTGPWKMNGKRYTLQTRLRYPGDLKQNQLDTPAVVNVKVKSLWLLALFLCLFVMLISNQVFEKVSITNTSNRPTGAFGWIFISGGITFSVLLIYYGFLGSTPLILFSFAFIVLLMGALGLFVIGYCDKSWIKGYFIVSIVCMIIPLMIYKSLLFIFPMLGLVLGYLVFKFKNSKKEIKSKTKKPLWSADAAG